LTLVVIILSAMALSPLRKQPRIVNSITAVHEYIYGLVQTEAGPLGHCFAFSDHMRDQKFRIHP
jgi:hypothetical protein